MHVKSGTQVPIADTAECVTAAFEGYIAGDITVDSDNLAVMMKENFVNADRSLLLFDDESDKPIAFAMMAVRPDRPTLSRVMGFGVIPSHAGKGHGKTFMRQVIESERKHGVKTLELECVQQNTPGVRLYSGLGFTIFKHLPGYERSSLASESEGTAPAAAANDEALKVADPEQVRALMQESVDKDVAWQAFNPPISDPNTEAYTLGHAHCIIGNPKEEGKPARLRCFFVEPEYRGKGEAVRLAKAVIAKIDKDFEVMAWFPSELVEPLATKLGLKVASLSQYQMRMDI